MAMVCSLTVRMVCSPSNLADSKFSTGSLFSCEQSILAMMNASSQLKGRVASNSVAVKSDRNAFCSVLLGSLTFIRDTSR